MLHRWATLPGYRRMMRTLTLGCGIVLLAEAVLRLALVALVPPDTMVGLSRVLQIVTVGGVVAWIFWYAKRSAPRWRDGPA